jgi:hypothetical protein
MKSLIRKSVRAMGLGARSFRFQVLQEIASEFENVNSQQAHASDKHFGISYLRDLYLLAVLRFNSHSVRKSQ